MLSALTHVVSAIFFSINRGFTILWGGGLDSRG